MPKIIKNTKYGILTFLEQATITIGDAAFPLRIERFNGPDSCLTFFGEEQLFKEIDETPHPRDYFKKFRAERYQEELRFLSTIHTNKEIKRDVFRSFYAQIAIEASRLFPSVEGYAKPWLERKMKSQRCAHDFEQVWCAYRSWIMPTPDGIFSTIYFRNNHCLKWLSLRQVIREQTVTNYIFAGNTVMNGSGKIHKKFLPCRVKPTDPVPSLVPGRVPPLSTKAN